METTFYLIRHGATQANLAHPYRLQGRSRDLPLAPVGVRQVEATRALLARIPFAACYTSPMHRAMESARILCEPHSLIPTTLDDLTECDVGRWENMTWDMIRADDPEGFARFESDPTRPYPDGESFAHTRDRGHAAVELILSQAPGQKILVVSHHVVLRTLLATWLGLQIGEAKRVSLSNAGVSVVVHSPGKQSEAFKVGVVNANLHLSESG